MGQSWSALYFLIPSEKQANIQSEHVDARKSEQDKVISELKSMEQRVYCYLDMRLKILLLPYANWEFLWDKNPEILPTIRMRPQSPTKSCYHCEKGPLTHHYSCQIIDRIFDKETITCHCKAVDTSSESLSPLLLTDSDSNSDSSDYEISED